MIDQDGFPGTDEGSQYDLKPLPRGLTVHGPGSHNVTSGGARTPTNLSIALSNKLPSDEEIDKLIDSLVIELGTVPVRSEMENMRELVRDWLAAH